MVWSEVSITHSFTNIGMTENALQYQNIAPIHHEVTGEGMAQYMRLLPFRQFNVGQGQQLF